MNKAYLLEMEPDFKYFSILPDDSENWPKSHIKIDWWEPETKGKNQKNIDLTNHYQEGEAEAREYSDFWSWIGWTYISDDLKKILVKASVHKKADEVYGFFTPTFVNPPEKLKRKGYSVIWIKDFVKCLDTERTVYRKSGSIKTRAVRHAAVDGLMHIFYIAEDPTSLCVSHQLAEVLRDSGLKGIHLEPIEAT